jgi:hypothetical protein
MPPTFIENLTTLLTAAGDDATPETVSELTAMAKRMTELGVTAPKPQAAPKADPKQSARDALAALPAELPRGASDADRLANARERARHLTVLYPHLQTDINGNSIRGPSGGGEAA